MLNRVVLIGRLTRDPELRYTPSGVAVASFTLAVDRSFSKDKEADFINIVIWRESAENCAKYLAKGKMAAVDGRLQIRSYEAKDGTKRTIAEVIAENVKFLSPADGRSNPATAGQKSNDNSNDFTDSLSDEDVPF